MIKIGQIYKIRYPYAGGVSRSVLRRITRAGGAGFYSGRGCTPQQATPDNHIRESDVTPANLEEVNAFLELEMKNGMAQENNIPLIRARGIWNESISSGYNGFLCKRCGTWVYANMEKRCDCDYNRDLD